ncbi:MAG: ABC transporter ATP-binding protein [Planctomycetota bacterium]|jgi:lipoprotein-releasing system ATP-binding protein
MSDTIRRQKSMANHESNPERNSRIPLRVARPIALRGIGIEKSYRKRNVEVPVLKGVDLEIALGEFTAIVGQSGSGKSTLLHLLGTLDAPDAGEIWYDQQRIDDLPSRQRDHLRNREFGLIFQFYHLLPELTVLENVLVSQMVQLGVWGYYRRRKENVARASELIERVGLSHRLKHRPSQLSGGEMQRTAIARALMSRPRVLLADEPTGNLDRENGSRVLETLLDLCREEQLTVVMVTHDEQIAKSADAVVRLVDGRIA